MTAPRPMIRIRSGYWTAPPDVIDRRAVERWRPYDIGEPVYRIPWPIRVTLLLGAVILGLALVGAGSLLG